MSRGAVITILIIITMIAAGLRLYGLDKQSLWYDEVSEETAFQRQFFGDKTQVISAIPDNPPLHLFFIYPVTKIFPHNDFALRMVPFTFGLISVPLMFLLGRRLFNEKIGLIASFLLAISPFHIWYSQEVRMYALLWMLSLLSLIYFLRALEQPSNGNYTGYLISTVAALYTLQFAVFLLMIQGLYLLLFIREYKTQLFKWVGIFSLTVLLYLPWIIHNITFLGDRLSGFPKQVDLLTAGLYTFYSYAAGFSIGPSLRELHINQNISVIKPYFLEVGSSIVVYGMLFMLGLWSIRKNYHRLLLLLLLIIIPVIIIFMFSKIIPFFSYNVRYTTTTFFGFLFFIANGVSWLNCLKPVTLGKVLAILVMVIITGFSAYSYSNYQFNKKYAKPDIRGAKVYIKENILEGDIAFCIVDSVTFNRYSKDDFKCLSLSSDETNNKTKIEAKLQKIVDRRKRLWLVLSREWYADKKDYAKTWLDMNYEEIKALHKGINDFANVRIYCYDLTKIKKL